MGDDAWATLLAGPSAPTEAEELLADLAHLDLLGSFRDPVAPMVAVDVLERHVPAVADAAAGLHGTVAGGVAGEAIRPVVAHATRCVTSMWWRRSSDHAVNRMSCRNIVASVCSSTSGNWIAWLRASGFPQVVRPVA